MLTKRMNEKNKKWGIGRKDEQQTKKERKDLKRERMDVDKGNE